MPTQPTELPTPPTARSADEIRTWIVGELCSSLNVAPSEIDTAGPLDSLGIDSLAAIGLAGGLAGWLNRELSATVLWDHPSIDLIANALANRNDAPDVMIKPGVIDLQPNGERRPVFFLPGLGGHPVTFAPLASHLGPHHPCYGIAVPGLDGEREPLTRVEEIAAAMLDRVRLVQPKGPYQLAGYSFGGLLAYEAAQQLAAAGETVSMLAIYDAYTPAGRTVRPRWQRMALHTYLIATRRGRLKYLRERLPRRGRVAPPANAESSAAAAEPALEPVRPLGAKIREVSKANALAAANYRPQPYAGSVLLFRAADRPAHDVFYKTDPSHGWGELVRGGVRVVDLPGSHLGLLSDAHAPSAADALRPALCQQARA